MTEHKARAVPTLGLRRKTQRYAVFRPARGSAYSGARLIKRTVCCEAALCSVCNYLVRMVFFAVAIVRHGFVARVAPRDALLSQTWLSLEWPGPGRRKTKKPRRGGFFDVSEWCRREDSNFRPTHYECVALPTELLRHAEEGAQYSGRRRAGKDPRTSGTRQLSSRIRINSSMLSLRVPSGNGGSSLKRTRSSGISCNSPVSTL